jgi:hypothetical protein
MRRGIEVIDSEKFMYGEENGRRLGKRADRDSFSDHFSNVTSLTQDGLMHIRRPLSS